MKFLLNRKHLFVVSLGLIVVTNIFVLLGVWYNQSAEPIQSFELSERELSYPRWRSNKEDSSTILQLSWRVPVLNVEQYYAGDAVLVNKERLLELGYDPKDYSTTNRDYNRYSQEAFVVMEFNGDVYQQHLAKLGGQVAKTEEDSVNIADRIEKAKNEQSRLFAIDVGIDAELLRQQYPHENILIIPATIRIDYYQCDNLRAIKIEKRSFICPKDMFPITISSIQVRDIMLSSTQAEKIRNLKYRKYDEPFVSRYSAKVSWGGLYRPWVADIWLTDSSD